MIRTIIRKLMAFVTAIFWTDKSKVFSGVLACFWSVQHIACAYGTDDGLECDDDCLYDPVVDTVATLGDLPPCDYIGKNDVPTFVASENADYYCSEHQWLSSTEILCEEKPPIKPFEYEFFTDPRDGYVYRLTRIGSQTWFAENLRFKTEKSIAPDGELFNVVGRYYTWKDAQTACPAGFHIPTSEEWKEMWLFVTEDNGCENVGTSLKTDSLWSEYLKPSTNIVQGNEDALVGTNRYGFNAVPAGSYLEKSDELYLLGHLTRFWSNDNYRGKIVADSWVMNFWRHNFFDDESANPNLRISVRCVKDFE